MSPEENKALVRHYLEEIYRGNLDILDTVISEEYRGVEPPPPGMTAIEDYKLGFSGLRRGFPDVAIRFDAIIAEDDWVALHCTIQGTHLGTWRGIPPTGKHATWTATVFRRVRDGKLVEGFGTWDILGLLQQLGVIDTPLEPAIPSGDGQCSAE
jgi:predicted ester cyclase